MLKICDSCVKLNCMRKKTILHLLEKTRACCTENTAATVGTFGMFCEKDNTSIYIQAEIL